MLLVTIAIGATNYKISNEDIALESPYDAYITGFTPPYYELSHNYGGYLRLGYGNIDIHPTFFSDIAVSWPPPISIGVIIKYTATTEAAATTLFTATGHRNSGFLETVSYKLYGESFSTNLLSTVTDYDGATVPIPRAFGAVTHVNPLRLPDDGSSRPTYHKGYVAGTVSTDWFVYDDSVDICANVVDNGDGTFSLTSATVGEVTLSGTGKYGTGSDTKFSSIMEWACGASYLNLTFNSTLMKTVQPTVSYWANSQNVLIDFLAELSAFCYHLFYISGTTLYIIDMDTTNGTNTIEPEFDAISVRYTDSDPVKIIRSNWVTRAGVTETIGTYVKDYNHETYVESAYPYGVEMNIAPFHDTKTNIDAQLTNILGYIHKPSIELSLPFNGYAPAPATSISWVDSESSGNIVASFLVHESISFDFTANSVTIKGKGSIA